MLPLVFSPPYANYSNLNPFSYYMIPQTYAYQIPAKSTCDQGCQFPEPQVESQDCLQNKEEVVEKELFSLLQYLQKHISLLKDNTFDSWIQENLNTLLSISKDIPYMIKKKYIQVNKTKEEMTKFIIRRCFLFIKSQIAYQEDEGLQAEERDRLFYHTFFSADTEFINSLKEETIDDMIPFRKDSKTKTMNDAYLKKLFESKRFSHYFVKFLAQFKEIQQRENEEKIENMTKQMIKIIFTRDLGKIKNYRRFPWKDHEILKCEERAKELFQKYNSINNKKSELKYQSKQDSHTFDFIDKLSESIQ